MLPDIDTDNARYAADLILKAVHSRENGRNSTGNGFPKVRTEALDKQGQSA